MRIFITEEQLYGVIIMELWRFLLAPVGVHDRGYFFLLCMPVICYVYESVGCFADTLHGELYCIFDYFTENIPLG